MTPPAPRYYTAPGVAGPRTIDQIATMAGCGTPNARLRVREGKPIAGHVWTPADGVPARTGTRGKVRKLMVSDAFPGQTFSQAEVRAMGSLSDKTPLQPYVRKQMRIGGHVWRFEDCAEDLARLDKPAAPAPARGNWRKDRHAEPAAPAPEGRRWVWAAESELMPVNERRIQAADGPSGVTL